MEGYKTDGPTKPEEVAIGESNRFRVTEGELEDVATAEYGPDGKPVPVTVREVLYGDGSGRPPRGIMSAMVEAGAFAEKFPPGYQNREARRTARKKARGR